MRIIGGKFKGKKLLAPKNIDARPTTDVAKEGLFNILANRVDFEELAVLDLYAGTGNISYEFGSRGAVSIIAVDVNRVSCEYIYKMAKTLDLPIKIRRFDATRFLSKCTEKFDLIFADPPYHQKGIEGLIDLVFDNECLNKDGIFILEHSRDYNFTKSKYFLEQRKYGKVNFSFFKLGN